MLPGAIGVTKALPTYNSMGKGHRQFQGWWQTLYQVVHSNQLISRKNANSFKTETVVYDGGHK